MRRLNGQRVAARRYVQKGESPHGVSIGAKRVYARIDKCDVLTLRWGNQALQAPKARVNVNPLDGRTDDGLEVVVAGVARPDDTPSGIEIKQHRVGGTRE